jgi:quinol monooxygenase YgiN/mannose-6-phosphate isomerase-like protein (cupin superfamily)
MTPIARYGRLVAQAGKGEALGEILLRAAERLREDPGCELYLVNRQADEPDTLWVTELWQSQEALDESLKQAKEGGELAAAAELIAEGGSVELEQLGGKGLPGSDGGAASAYTLRRLTDVKDSAEAYGLVEYDAARFANDELETEQTGVSLQRLSPGRRQSFGHHHATVEEVYVVIAGSGRLKLDDEIEDVARLDAIRIAPAVTRAFEAGDEGLEYLAFGPRRAGDGEMIPDWWKD